MSLSKEILRGTYQGVERLLDQRAPINIMDEFGYTPLIQAVVTNKYDIASLLLKKNADPALVDISGSTALHWAIDNNNYKMVNLLLHHKADPNAYTTSGMPTLFYPLLRRNKDMIRLLVDKGANMDFAKDFINAKLVGHRFELQGSADIVNPHGLFFAIDLEGFYLECTLDLIRDSLERFIHSYLAHRMDIHEPELQIIIRAIENAVKLREFKHISKKVDDHKEAIHLLLTPELLLLPVSFEGHAITFIKHDNFLAKCDRGVLKMTDPIVINTVAKPDAINNDFYTHLLYKPHRKKYIKQDLIQILGLNPYAKLPIKHQVTGNCSWANVEASVPTMLYMLLHKQIEKDPKKVAALVKEIMTFYHAWLEWDKDRAIEDLLIDFEKISFPRQKSKAALLGSVLLQASNPNNPNDVKRAKKILSILSRKDFHYIVRIYANIFVRGKASPEGQAFKQMIEKCGHQLSEFSH